MKKIVLKGLLLLLAAGLAFSVETGRIEGKVFDQQGNPLPGVTIEARSPSLQGVRKTVSLRDGSFILPLLPVGRYTLTFSLEGFATVVQKNVIVRLGQTTYLEVRMQQLKFREEITVTAAQPLIDKVSTDTSYRIGSEELELLPTQTRTAVDIVKFTPGVTGVRANTKRGVAEGGLPSFRGEGAEGNNWLVDGLSIRGVRLADEGLYINYDAIEEVQIISDPFSPDLTSAFGGIVNMVTKSGGNEFHGEAGVLFFDKHLQAAKKEQLSLSFEPASFSRHTRYFNLGGPIVRDRLWFFFSENVFYNKDLTNDGYIDYLFVPGGEQSFLNHSFFGKLSLALTSNHTISLSVLVKDLLSQEGGIGLPELYRTFSSHDRLYILSYRGILSPTTFVEASLGRVRSDSGFEPAHGDMGPAMYFIEDIAQNVHNSLGKVVDNEYRTSFFLRFTHVMPVEGFGIHEIGAGFEYYRAGSEFTVDFTGKDEDPFPGNGFDSGTKYAFRSWKEGQRTPTLLWEYGPFAFVNSISGIGLYLMDRATFGRFTVMLGFRTYTQNNYDDRGGIIWKWGLADFFSPRAFITWDITGDGVNVVKAGWGIFTDLTTTLHLGFFNPQAPVQFRRYRWVGPENPDESQLHDPANWEFINEERRGPYDIAPNIKPNKLQRILLEYDRRLGPFWALKLRYVRSWARNLLELIGVFDPNPPYYRFIFDNFELKRRDYSGFEVELNGRINETLILNASYTWASAKGTNPGQVETGSWGEEEGGTYYISLFGKHIYVPDLPELRQLKELFDWGFGGLGGPEYGDEGWYGKLPYSVDHNVKVNLTWLAPYSTAFSVAFEWLSGYHWEKRGLVPFFGYYAFPEGRGSRTTPAHAYLDVGVEKSFDLSKLGPFPQGASISLRLDVFNLLNSQKPIAYVREDTPAFGKVWGRQQSRQARLMIRLRW